MIIFTSDHGDYLGDHWMGEKLYFHEQSVRVPLIVVDPSPQADATRGTVDAALTESIDLVPTIVDYMGGELHDHILEGRSLMPLLHGQNVAWRDCVFSQADFGRSATRKKLNSPTDRCRMVMAFDGRWKYVQSDGQPPMLFDLESDPQELTDLGDDPAYEIERRRMQVHIQEWALHGSYRITQTSAFIEAKPPEYKKGVIVGFWNQEELDKALGDE